MAAMEDVVMEIERLLALEDVPASPPQPAQGGNPAQGGSAPAQAPGHARGYQIGKFLHAAKAVIDKKHNANADDEAFIDYAKVTSTTYASVYNTVNLFGATTSYLIRDDPSSHLNNHHKMRAVFIGLALAFLPFTLLTVGFAHSLKPQPDNHLMLNIVATMLLAETIYMAVMCSFFGYYLIDNSNEVIVISIAVVLAAVLIVLPIARYKRPA